MAARDLVVIGRDRRVRSKPGELARLLDSGLRVFWIAGKRDLSTWDYLVRLVNRWQDSEGVVAERGPGPWFMAIREADVSEIALRSPRRR